VWLVVLVLFSVIHCRAKCVENCTVCQAAGETTSILLTVLHSKGSRIYINQRHIAFLQCILSTLVLYIPSRNAVTRVYCLDLGHCLSARLLYTTDSTSFLQRLELSLTIKLSSRRRSTRTLGRLRPRTRLQLQAASWQFYTTLCR
jgi:hypothetical protein